MDKAEVISVNSSPPLTISSTVDNKDMMRITYKDDMVPVKTEPESNKTSCNSERVPVSWSERKHNIHSLSTKPHSQNSTTPSPKTKVTNWLSKKGNWSQVSVVTAPPRFVTDYKKSSILARHDFQKSYSITGCPTKGETVAKFSPCTPTSSLESTEVFERHNVFHIKTNCSDLPKHGMYEIENAVPSPSKAPISLINNSQSKDYNIFVKNSVKTEECEKINKPDDTSVMLSQIKPEIITVVREGTSSNTPLSPESVKKKELCTYLQLVNWHVTNKKKDPPNENRRSVRVKNNLLLSEKKENERKLNGEDSNASTSDKSVVEDASKMSFKELFGDNNALANKNHESDLQVKTEDVIVGYIPKELLEKREDFDDCAKEFFNRENVQVPQQKKQEKSRKLILKNAFMGKWVTQKPKATVKQKKVKEQFNRMFITPVKKNGVFSPGKKRYKDDKAVTPHKNLNSSKKNSVKCLLRSAIGKKVQNTSKSSKSPVRKKKFILESSTVKRKTRKTDESGDVAADVVMQDHDYICSDENDEVSEKLKNGEADCCDKSTSSLSPCHGFNSPDRSQIPCNEVNKLCLSLSEFLENEQNSMKMDIESLLNVDVNATPIKQEEVNCATPKVDIIDPNLISSKPCEYVALDPEIKPKSLHQTLGTQRARRRRFCLTDGETDEAANCDTADESASTSKQNKNDKRSTLSHSICTSKSAGAVVNAFYRNFNLIIVQEFEVTFWNQSALGNILGAHNMWLQKGQVSRLVLDNGCMQKDSNEMVISLENSIAYVELWTKEHKSDKREIPVADVFAAIYFCKPRQNGVFKKVLQLENIKR